MWKEEWLEEWLKNNRKHFECLGTHETRGPCTEKSYKEVIAMMKKSHKDQKVLQKKTRNERS